MGSPHNLQPQPLCRALQWWERNTHIPHWRGEAEVAAASEVHESKEVKNLITENLQRMHPERCF